ncbi:hypothetical protein SAMN05421837_103390 [Amycolatopsis pretoriensis]|uniref:Fibronectin type-III domain-containing protein n=1 Tax=Amycolatopsis pretoriensis TaxID=218821 RepID=A0A1H5QMF9_9PSEU|nr:hypothetical protein [Amycolatopsis pretoriensis]SEF26558.1 hypothetical protein SAMN05421837_103390 [Amycolatopsis pretoriensis]
MDTVTDRLRTLFRDLNGEFGAVPMRTLEAAFWIAAPGGARAVRVVVGGGAARVSSTPVPAPACVTVRRRAGRLVARWAPVPDATTYVVRLVRGGVTLRTSTVSGTTAVVPFCPLRRGRRYAVVVAARTRVRGPGTAVPVNNR